MLSDVQDAGSSDYLFVDNKATVFKAAIDHVKKFYQRVIATRKRYAGRAPCARAAFVDRRSRIARGSGAFAREIHSKLRTQIRVRSAQNISHLQEVKLYRLDTSNTY